MITLRASFAFLIFGLVLSSAAPCFAGVADDWDRYYKFAGPSSSVAQHRNAWKYQSKLIFDVMDQLRDLRVPVRTTLDGKAFSGVVWSHLAKDMRGWSLTGPPTPVWQGEQRTVRQAIEDYLLKKNGRMIRQYMDPGGAKHYQRYIYEWLEGDCIVRVSEVPGVQTTLTFYDLTDRKETDFPFLEHLMQSINPNAPVAVNPKNR